jgi:hypothetical protein
MKLVQRHEILDYVTYGEQRAAIREDILQKKSSRRVHLPPYLTFLFENTDTVRYQIQEMIRAEQIIREADIQHEIETYNGLLGGPGELGASLLIEIDDPKERISFLSRWLSLPHHIYLRLADARRVYALFDPTQVGERRLAAVQYLKFPVGTSVPVAIGVDHPEVLGEVALSNEQQCALTEDLQT